VWAICGAGLFTLLIAPWLANEFMDGIFEGLSIFVAVILIVALSAGNDYMKDKQFQELISQCKDEECTVVRGKNGATQSVNVFELVIGDCILLEAGSRVSADCILVEGSDVIVNDSYYHGGEIHKSAKSAIDESSIDANPDCFILSQSLVVQGEGKAIVCAVGDASRRASVAGERIGISDDKTPLQEKLENLGQHFSKYGLYSAMAILVALVLNWIIFVSASDNATFGKELKKIMYAPITALMIIVVAVPEGLPLSIGISLAYSTKEMKKNNILVKRLESMEVMGTVQEIVTGKTGTLTEEDMNVTEWYSFGQVVQNKLKNTMCSGGFADSWIKALTDAILFNSSARIEMGDEATYVAVGSGTETAMLRFLQENQLPVHELIKRKLDRVQTTIPHTSARRRMTVAVAHPDVDDRVRVVVKGAPEILLSKCTRTYDNDGHMVELSDGDKQALTSEYLEKNWVNYNMGDNGVAKGNAYRSILYAFKDMDKEEFDSLKGEANFETEEDRQILESDLTLLAVFALDNPIRNRVAHAVKVGTQGYLTVRMVTGDSEGTAKAVALQGGIIHAADLDKVNLIMSGEQFRDAVGGVQTKNEGGIDRQVIARPDQFANIAQDLRVLYRATPEDKLALVAGLRTWNDSRGGQKGKVVAVTGEGTNDEVALHFADVGIAMGGSGCDLAKDASDIILTDDNFANSVKTAMWGRNIYQNIRKFLQFQVTMNISCCLVVFLGGATMGVSPFNVVQLLWINLIMDIFGALALATEPPKTNVLRYKPVNDKDSVMTKDMWRQILGVSVWISLTTLITYWSAAAVMGFTFPYGSMPNVEVEITTPKGSPQSAAELAATL
jgi:Ca2+ transporting ATPase